MQTVYVAHVNDATGDHIRVFANHESALMACVESIREYRNNTIFADRVDDFVREFAEGEFVSIGDDFVALTAHALEGASEGIEPIGHARRQDLTTLRLEGEAVMYLTKEQPATDWMPVFVRRKDLA